MKDGIMAVGFLQQKLDCVDLRKCGEITTRILVGKKETFLNCDFCDYTFLQLNYFIQHVYEEHLSNSVQLNLKQESTESTLRLGDADASVETDMQWECSFENNHEEQIVLNGFEKVEIDFDSSEINHTLDTEEAVPEEILNLESLQNFGENELAVISDEKNEDDSDSEFDWETRFANKKEDERRAKQKFILEFIEVYRSLPALWNTNSRAYHDNVQKNQQYKILLKKYRKRYPNATLNLVKQQIISLWSQYRREVNLPDSSRKSTLYYYDAMKFLNDIKTRSKSHSNTHALNEVPRSFKEDRDALLSDDSEITDDEEDVDEQSNKEEIRKENEIAPNKKFVLEFIALYKSLPALWDTNCADYRNRALTNKHYETLLAKFRESYPNADKDNVKMKIRSLRANFFKASKGRGPKQLYYYDAMTFLHNNYEPPESQNKAYDQEEIEVTSDASIETFERSDSLLSDAEFVSLAEIYKKHTCLWNEKYVEYNFSNRRREALESILDTFNKTYELNLTKRELDKEISNLRKISSDEKKRKIECKQEHMPYKPTCPYYKHIAYLEVDVTPYECEICGKILWGSRQYKVHLSNHDGSLPFKCTICGHECKKAGTLVVHLRRHVRDFTHCCKVCSKPCATSSDLKIHMSIHTGEKPYVCEVCGKSFRLPAKFKDHMDRHAERPRHKCEICSKLFYNSATLNDHFAVHLKIRDKVCDVCDKKFKTKKQLRQHKHIHDAEKKFICKICDKRFAQPAGLSAHMRSHGTSLSAKVPELE